MKTGEQCDDLQIQTSGWYFPVIQANVQDSRGRRHDIVLVQGANSQSSRPLFNPSRNQFKIYLGDPKRRGLMIAQGERELNIWRDYLKLYACPVCDRNQYKLTVAANVDVVLCVTVLFAFDKHLRHPAAQF